jgi:hypothetical protein
MSRVASKPSHPLLRAALAAGLGLTGCKVHTHTTTQNGVSVVKFGAEAEHLTLMDINEEVNEARQSLVTRVGHDLPAEKKEMDAADAKLAAAHAKLTDDLKDSPAYPKVLANLTDAEAWAQSAHLAWQSETALRALDAVQKQGKQATPAQLEATRAAVTAFDAAGNKNWSDARRSHQERLSHLTQENADAPQRAAKQASQAAAQKSRADREATERRLAGQLEHARKSLVALDGAIGRGDAIDDADVAALDKEGKELDAQLPGAGRSFREAALWLRLELALVQPDAASRVTTLVGGTAVSGETKGKAYAIPVKAQKERCYVLMSRFRSWTGHEKREDQRGVASGGGAPMQWFTVAAGHERGLEASAKLEGFCTVRDATVTYKGDLTFTGSTNGLAYVAMEFERAKFPLLFARGLDLPMPDHCDPEAWARMFTHPVPGTLAYENGEPVVIRWMSTRQGSHEARVVHAGLHWADGRDPRQLSVEPPAKVVFKTQFDWRACPGREEDVMPEAPVSRAIVECGDRISAKYGKAWDEVEAVRRHAANVSTSTVKFYSPEAEARAGRLQDAYDQEFAQKCQPMVEKAHKDVEKRFNKLVDELTDAPPRDALKRPDLGAHGGEDVATEGSEGPDDQAL